MTKVLCAAAFTTALVLGPAGPVVAETTLDGVGEAQLRDGNPQSGDAEGLWYRESTVNGGSVDIYAGSESGALSSSSAPGFGTHALALTTNHQSGSKAQLLTPHRVFNRALSDVNSVSYSTYLDSQSEPGNPGAKQLLPALQLQVDTNGLGTGGGFTTLVFEPYQETPTGPSTPIVPETWQQWEATNDQWWSTQAIDCGEFHLDAGAGGAPFTTPADIAAECPGAVILQFGVNVGPTPTQGVVTAVDGLHIGLGSDSYTWDFGPK